MNDGIDVSVVGEHGRAARASIVGRVAELELHLTNAATRLEFFGRSDCRRELEQRLDDLLEETGRPSLRGQVLSLDVFDTYLWRDSTSEVTRFREVSERMARILRAAGIDVRPVDALVARHLGTQASYRASASIDGCREGSLTEIHRVASRMLAGSDDFVQAFIDAELENEAVRCTVSPFWSEYLERHFQRGGRAILVSDMYLHADQITSLLSRLGVNSQRFELILSSADTKVSKASGGIFAVIETALDEPSSSFLHVGDSYKGDFAEPRRHGWRSMLLPIPEAELAARRADHRTTMRQLEESDGIRLDVALPR